MIKRKKVNNSVQYVVDRFLCSSCGTCAGVCPESAIKMEIDRYGIYTPVIDQTKCDNCGICIKVCPGHSFNYYDHYNRIQGNLPKHVALGAFKKCYVLHSKDQGILKISQSGGLVSTLLIYCLDNNLINGAVVSKWNPESPLEPLTYIARNRKEVLDAVGSKYNPVPAAQAISELLQTDGRFAFVGVSCQIQGFRKAEKLFPSLEKKIVLYIGLHCLGVFTYHFHDQILYKIGVKRENLVKFRHRDKVWRGWPCDMHIIDKEGKAYDIDARYSRLWPRPFFTSWRCQLCFDKANEYSDISCGDCRIPYMQKKFQKEGYDLKKGLSECVVRTERGLTIINRIIHNKKIVAYETDADAIASSIGVAGKKIGISTFIKVAKLLRLGIPQYGVNFSMEILDKNLKWKLSKPWIILSSSRYYFTFTMAKYKIVRKFFKHVPHRVFAILDKFFRRRADWSIYSGSSRIIRKMLK